PSTATVNIAEAAAPVITITASDANASEVGSDTGTFRLPGTGSNALELADVHLQVSGTADPGNDYTSPNLTGGPNDRVTFAAGSSTATVTVTPVSDTLVESSETVIVTVAAAANYLVGTPNAATVNIA